MHITWDIFLRVDHCDVEIIRKADHAQRLCSDNFTSKKTNNTFYDVLFSILSDRYLLGTGKFSVCRIDPKFTKAAKDWSDALKRCLYSSWLSKGVSPLTLQCLFNSLFPGEMASEILVKTMSGNGLLLNGIIPLHKQILLYHQCFRVSFIQPFLQKALNTPIDEIGLKITLKYKKNHFPIDN